MAGYTPVFSTIYGGSLYGRRPAAAVWASLLPLMDKNGEIDMSITAIVGMTGWPVALLEEGIRQLMEADPYSRSPEHDGRRLVPLDGNRPWGWKAVNHGKYREKARKQMQQMESTESGRDAERKRLARERTAAEKASSDVQSRPASPAKSGSVRLSDADSDTDKDPEGDSEGEHEGDSAPDGARAPPPKAKGPKAKPRTQIGERTLSDANRAYALAKVPDIDADATYAQFRDHHLKLATVFADWDAGWRTWIGNITTKGFAYVRAPRTQANRASSERITREQWKAGKNAAGGV